MFNMSGVAQGIANGPSRPPQSERDAQIWERPWSLEEMRQNSANWSLAADSGLFLFLQDFSQRMLSKTHEIEKQLDSLIRDTKATDSCLHSVFNDFLMLSNTQFIENRVYDEDVEDTAPKADALEKQPEQEKTREQKEAELIPKIQEAVQYGLRVLESAFEHLDIKAGNSDSEDEEVTDRAEAILEPKDLYVDRPLPYLIGSQPFMEQDDVGLGDLSSDDMSVDSDRDSVIDSEEDKPSVHSDDDFNQEEDEAHSNIKKKSSVPSYDEDEEEDSDIFGESDKDDDDDEDDDVNAKNTGPSSFADELAARIKGEPVNKPEGDRASLTSKKKNKSRKAPKPAKPQADEDSDDMFKPPKMEDDDFSPFGGKSGLFSGGKGLFDDDDEGDLFSEAPKRPVSEEKKTLNDSKPSADEPSESAKPGKRIPPGGVLIFPGNNLFSSENDSDSMETKENGTRAPQTGAGSKQVSTGVDVVGGGGLFDEEEEEEEEEDGFFSGKSLKSSDRVVKEKPKPKKAISLFDEDDEDGDIFSEKLRTPTQAQSKKEAVEDQGDRPHKKMPAGAISMFGPGTKSLLSEGLKKRQPSASEESEKSEEYGATPDTGKSAIKQIQIRQTGGLFSDDEDAQVFSTTSKSQAKPEPTSQNKSSKAPLSLFDDEEEEDLFAAASTSKPKPHQAKATTPQPSKAVSSSLFSDDEDQWLIPKSATKPEAKTGGMKASVSAPSSLPSAKTPQKSSLFNDDEDDDLFVPTKNSSEKKPQRVALLFEDEEDDDKGPLFGIKAADNNSTPAPAANTPAVTSQLSSVLEKTQEVAVSLATAEDKLSEKDKTSAKTPETLLSSPSSTADNSISKKKPAGAVSLFGGINVLNSKLTKSPLDDEDDNDKSVKSKDSLLPNVKDEKEQKVKTNALSLFDEEEEDDSDWNDPMFTPSKTTVRKLTEEQPQAKSTGVFQDEELLFSHTQQKDNDPDVDLFATSGKTAGSKPKSVKPAAQSLFSDEGEDDLFSSTKPKAPPPKVAEKPSKSSDKAPLASPETVLENQKPEPSPVKPKDSTSRIGKLQANLMINPATLLPGAVPNMAPSSSSGVSSSSLSPSPATSPIGPQTDNEEGVSFDVPVQVTTLQSTHKSRVKGSVQRRPQSRAARQQAAQKSVEDREETLSRDGLLPNSSSSGLVLPPTVKSTEIRAGPTPLNSTIPTSLLSSLPSQPSPSEVSRPSVLTLPVSTDPGKKDSKKDNHTTKVVAPLDEDDLFGSDSLFDTSSTSRPSSRQSTKTTQPQASSGVGLKKDKDKTTLPSIFDDNTDDLFQKAKPKSATKKAQASTFLVENDDDDEDLFGVSNSSSSLSTSSKEVKSAGVSKQDIFQDDIATVSKGHKRHKEKSFDASLFDDDIDIFADLTDSVKPKQKPKTKGETKSIFDDDMDDIFSPNTVKPVAKVPQKSKKTPLSQETSTATDSSNIFDDPLNALGGN
ncbi:WASH complex subunit 2 isoform X2 [Betta splendens]|uniref:WASH complex subunit 2 isoform X2 n=1 Tax=Betta splendens TaxID=158456 RepID=A0A6P7PF82_BETSP|nr:WASH complex subunit 2 isoform X2 [Betta splendens]